MEEKKSIRKETTINVLLDQDVFVNSCVNYSTGIAVLGFIANDGSKVFINMTSKDSIKKLQEKVNEVAADMDTFLSVSTNSLNELDFGSKTYI